MDMLKVYLDFVEERHRVWERRQAGQSGPWTTDPVLANHKFTNVFRVLDYGSQFLLGELLMGEDRGDITYGDALARAFLYRYTNRPEPWELFSLMYGRYPLQLDLDSGLVLDTWRTYREAGGPMFGNAYKMFSGLENKGTDRLTWAVDTARLYTGKESELSVVPLFARATSMDQRLTILQTIPRCAGFMSMQIVTDMGYTAFFRGNEDEAIVAGPGALVGLSAIGFDLLYSPEEGIAEAQCLIHSRPGCPRLPLHGKKVRLPSLMDVQNTLCEFGKYTRYLGKVAGSAYKPAHPEHRPVPVLPEHW